MNNDRYRKIFEDLARDLFAVAKRHGKRALREAVRDAANGNLIQEDSAPPEEMEYPDEGVLVIPVSSDAEEATAETEEERTTEEESGDDDTPPEDLEYPDETVWDVPPAPEDEESKSGNEDEEDPGEEDDTDEEQTEGEDPGGEHELSDAAERVLDRLMDRLKNRAEK